MSRERALSSRGSRGGLGGGGGAAASEGKAEAAEAPAEGSAKPKSEAEPRELRVPVSKGCRSGEPYMLLPPGQKAKSRFLCV